MAKDLNQAIEICKSDPRFEDGEWRLEVRPIMKVAGIINWGEQKQRK